MTTEQTSPGPRYTTLRDYTAVLRRYWWLILIIGLIGAGAGAADALRKTAVYTATVSVGFQDPNQNFNTVGLPANSTQTLIELAAVNATAATSPAVMTRVKRQLKTPLSVSALTGAVSTQVVVGSDLLQISVNTSTPAFAASLANTVANTLVAQDNQKTRAQFARLASELQKRIAKLKPLPGGAPNPQQSFYQGELPRLETLSTFATSAQVVDPAQQPSGPSSPHKARETALGLALGLLLGILAAFVRDSMDRRLRRPGDFESAFEFPVIGHVRKGSLGHVAYASNGAGELDPLDLEAFRILRRNVEFLDPERAPTVVLVTSAVAEEGKTTVASSLAFVLAAAGKRALLVDCDLRRPDLAGRVGVELSPGLSEYLAGLATMEEVLRTVTFSDRPLVSKKASKNGSAQPEDSESSGAESGRPSVRSPLDHELVCIPAGTVTSRGSELLGTARFKEFLEYAAANYDVVVLDSSPILPVADTLEILPHVDSIVICARQSRTTRDQARAIREALGRFPRRPTGVVVTGIKPRGAEYEVYAYSYSYT